MNPFVKYYVKVLNYLRSRHNFTLKILALLAAVLLWVYVVLQSPVKKSIYVPIVINKPDSLIYDIDPPDSVRFDFTGSARNFFLFDRFGDPTILVELKNLNIGENIVEISPDQIIYSDWIGVKPEGETYIRLSFQKLDSIYLPISSEQVMTLPPGWIITEQNIDPEMIWIVGGSQDLEDLSKVGISLNKCNIDEFKYSYICSTTVEIPEYPTHPFTNESIVEVNVSLDSMIFYQLKLPVIIDQGQQFQAMPDSVRFYAIVPSRNFQDLLDTDIKLRVDVRRSEIHSSPLILDWNGEELAETSWLEINKVKLIPAEEVD